LSIVLKTIESFPRGRTTSELCALLDVEFDANKRAAIRAELTSLQHDGLVRLGRDGKWRLTMRLVPSAATDKSAQQPSRLGHTLENELIAVAARFSVTSAMSPEAPVESEDSALPDPHALLRYYRAAVRSDPRGALTQTIDTYGTSHVLLSGAGNLWPVEDGEQGEIRVRLQALPDKFREALKRRDANENALAVGWPISVGSERSVPVVRPVGLIAGEWEHVGNELIVRLPHADILVNPDWVKASARGTAWRQSDLAAVFRATEGVGLSKVDIAERLREAQATAIRGKLTGTRFAARIDLAQVGIHDALGLFLPTDSTFTSGAVRDLDQIATWSRQQLSETALAPLLGLAAEVSAPDLAPINIGPINLEQFEAVKLAMSRPLTVVTGPPGTGKSQAIVAMVATALNGGESVLVASKNHQALDAVEERLSEIAPEVKFLVRTLNPGKEIDVSVKDVMKLIVDDDGATGSAVDPFLKAQLNELALERLAALEVLSSRRTLNIELADLIERRELRRKGQPQGLPDSQEAGASWWLRLLRLLRIINSGESPEGQAPDEKGLSLQDLDRLIRDRRAAIDALAEHRDPIELTEKITELARSVVARALSERSAIDRITRETLGGAHDDHELQGYDDLPRQVIDSVVDTRPLWLASILGTPKRIPLHRGIFDLVIFDEASQCDIGTALPLLARARRAVVVGDDRQLAFISQIGAAKDRNLMATQGLPKRGTGRFAQGRKSLFDLASSTPNSNRVMLRDQYRSDPDIVEYISTGFYGARLRASANPAGFRTPDGFKSGLSWTHVSGQRDAARQGNVNPAEVKEIATQTCKLLLEQGYDGSVGVITPFRAQALALEQALMATLPDSAFTETNLRISTVDGFQGQERDVILFSPAVCAVSPSSAITFIQRDWRRINVAISRARAVCHIVGDLDFARSGKIKTLATLATRATGTRASPVGESVFDSHWERIVYHALRERGLEPEPQYQLAGRRLDFAIFSKNLKLDLEIDGRRWHQDIDGNRKADDIWRDHQLKALGWRVRRFWVDELSRDLEGCLDLVERDLS
jgi:very-short-patch-repair endonuclease